MVTVQSPDLVTSLGSYIVGAVIFFVLSYDTDVSSYVYAQVGKSETRGTSSVDGVSKSFTGTHTGPAHYYVPPRDYPAV